MQRRCRDALSVLLLLAAGAAAEELPNLSERPGLVVERVRRLAAERPSDTGAYLLSKGREAIMARAWMVNNASETLDIQTLIWKMDGLGTLATEAILRAADRGARVRVIVDAYERQAPKDLLLALARHPKVDIRIYNPPGPSELRWVDSLLGLLFAPRRLNQRMHNKKFLIDGRLGITGGRNVADEYFQYNAQYNYHDRDVLLLGRAAVEMGRSFEQYWGDPLSKAVEELWEERDQGLSQAEVEGEYARLHERADDPQTVPPEVHEALRSQPEDFWGVLDRLVWTDVRFVSDRPEKNIGEPGLGGGGRMEAAVATAFSSARERIIIQNPYVALSAEELSLDDQLERGVDVWISTNSLASTDNLPAFSGYRKERPRLLRRGVHLRELKPHPALQEEEVHRRLAEGKKAPILSLHAKTAVIDGTLLFVGTFNLDPRSANLNTEEGVLIRSRDLALEVEAQIRRDMGPENSWDPASENTDEQAGLGRRIAVWLLGLLPLKPLL